eukprot:GGOE01050045.1.p1 GENE.GGOE01050045.1~~GGOE01050045.1.p1  ORF type:complete len:670 (+),score=160.85 GGOE01050045.1:23-2011(+)
MPEPAIPWWVPVEPLARVWRPSAHHHSLRLCYRFVDPELEAQFVQHSACVRRVVLRVYCAFVLLAAIQQFLVHVNPPICPLLWTSLTMCAVPLLLLFISCFSWVLPYVVPLHSLGVCAIGAVVAYHLEELSSATNAASMAYICGHEPPGSMDPALYVRVGEGIQQLVGVLAVYMTILGGGVHWVSLGLAGFSGWTVLAHAAILLSSVTGIYHNSMVASKEVAVLYCVACTAAFCVISAATERARRSAFLMQTQLSRELHATQLADGMLNHMLKDTLANVTADIEIFLAGELGPEVLEDAVVCLRRGLQSCRERMVFLKMVAGEYAPVLSAIGLQEFSQQLVAGSNITTHAPDLTVLMDGTLMQLVLEHAMSNAVKHGHPDHPDVQLIIRKEEPKDSAVNVDGRQLVSFTVQNAAHPLRPRLRADLIHHFLVGETRMQTNTMPALSAGVGLLQCGLAARLGGIALSLCQEGDVVSFTATMEAEVMEATTLTEDDFPLASHFPGGLKIFCLDDSAAMRRLMEFQLKRWCPSAVVRIYGALEDDVHAFMSEALQDADIVILDQNLEYAHPHYGTDLCRQLIRFGFRGLICIRSSDDSQDDQAKYAASGAHCSFGKDVPVAKVVQQLKAAYVLNVLLPTADQSDPALRSLLAPLRFSSGPFPASPE